MSQPPLRFPGPPSSPLERAPARLKLTLSASLGAVLLGFSQPVVPVLATLTGAFLHVLAKVNPLETIRVSWPALPLALALGAVNGVAEGWISGALLAWRLILLLWIGHLIARCTSSLEMVHALERLFRFLPLRWLGWSSRDLALMLLLAIRFLPILQHEISALRKAQKARAFSPRRLSWKARGKHQLLLGQLLLDGMARRADQVSHALMARGYRPGPLSGSSGLEAR